MNQMNSKLIKVGLKTRICPKYKSIRELQSRDNENAGKESIEPNKKYNGVKVNNVEKNHDTL